MENLQQLKEALTAKEILFIDHKTNQRFGVYLGGRVWHWFTYYSTGNRFWLLFKHSYSADTGKSKKGIQHEQRVLHHIERETGLKLFN